jgi:predicted ATPase/transcriptional regulator with XRE-family HTH domain
LSDNNDVRQPALLASLLTRHMADRGWSIDQLATKSTVHRSTIYRWQKGISTSAYDFEKVIRLAAALELHKVDANQLLRAAGQPTIDMLGVHPGDELRELLQRWQKPIRNNLPAPLTSFVGREAEIDGLCELLPQRYVRLITLTGAGGSGKTRLALRLTREVLDVFPDGVFFVSLAALTDARLIIPAIAEAIGLRDSQDTALKTRLHGWLRERQVLLILDNLEHLTGVGTEIVDLLRAARELTILATSRVPLRLSPEYEWSVPPLPLPEAVSGQGRRALRLLRENPAIDLFVQRGQAVRYVLDDEDLPVIAEICTRLDGLPLAIELAAVQLRGRNPQDLLAKFPSALELAASGPHDLPERQQTLRATIAWSVDLLPDHARAVLLQLSVFAGGWTEDAARAICSATPADLERLTSANLIHQTVTASGTTRYGMLETIREYSREQLAAGGREQSIRDRHTRYFLALAESAPPYVPEARTTGWYDRIDADIDNMRAALDWAEFNDDHQLLARLTVAMWPYWHEYQQVHEGRRRLETILRYREELDLRLRAMALTGAATLASTQSVYDIALTYGQEALTLWQRLDDHRGQALTSQQLGWVAIMSGDMKRATELFKSLVEHWRATGDPLGIAGGLSNLAAVIYISGDFDAALPYLLEADRLQRDAGDEPGIARSLCDLGLHALLQGDAARAIPLLSESVDRLQAVRSVFLMLRTRFYLATALCLNGQLDEARDIYLDLLQLHEEIDDRSELSLTLLGFAAVAHRQGDAHRSAILCGAVDAILLSSRIALPPAVTALYDHEVSLVLQQIDPTTFAQAFEEGHAMTVEDAIRFARESSVND